MHGTQSTSATPQRKWQEERTAMWWRRGDSLFLAFAVLKSKTTKKEGEIKVGEKCGREGRCLSYIVRVIVILLKNCFALNSFWFFCASLSLSLKGWMGGCLFFFSLDTSRHRRCESECGVGVGVLSRENCSFGGSTKICVNGLSFVFECSSRKCKSESGIAVLTHSPLSKRTMPVPSPRRWGSSLARGKVISLVNQERDSGMPSPKPRRVLNP